MPEWTNSCPNGHHSVADDGMCNVTTCGHCDPVVSKPTRTGNGKAPDGKASVGGWLGKHPPKPQTRRR